MYVGGSLFDTYIFPAKADDANKSRKIYFTNFPFSEMGPQGIRGKYVYCFSLQSRNALCAGFGDDKYLELSRGTFAEILPRDKVLEKLITVHSDTFLEHSVRLKCIREEYPNVLHITVIRFACKFFDVFFA